MSELENEISAALRLEQIAVKEGAAARRPLRPQRYIDNGDTSGRIALRRSGASHEPSKS
jgi:hypothetical protein